MEVYKHSGAVPLGGALLTTFASLIATILFGVVYTYAVVWIPFIYITVLLTLALGFLIGHRPTAYAGSQRLLVRSHIPKVTP